MIKVDDLNLKKIFIDFCSDNCLLIENRDYLIDTIFNLFTSSINDIKI